MSVLETELSDVAIAATVLHVPESTLRWWPEGGVRGERNYRIEQLLTTDGPSVHMASMTRFRAMDLRDVGPEIDSVPNVAISGTNARHDVQLREPGTSCG